MHPNSAESVDYIPFTALDFGAMTTFCGPAHLGRYLVLTTIYLYYFRRPVISHKQPLAVGLLELPIRIDTWYLLVLQQLSRAMVLDGHT